MQDIYFINTIPTKVKIITRKLFVRDDLEIPDYEEYEEYEEYNFNFDEFEAFLKSERDLKYTPSLAFQEGNVRISLSYENDYEMMLSQKDWYAYASWKALGVKELGVEYDI